MFYTHCTDATGRIVAVNDAWIAFAQKNWRTDFKPAMILGRNLDEFINGPDTQAVFRLAVHRVRSKKRSLTLPFRCDSPDQRRFMEMTITPLDDDGLEYSCLILREEVRAPVVFLPCGARRPGAAKRSLVACSVCLRLQRPAWGQLRGPEALAGKEEWLEAERVLPLVAILEEGYFPPLTYAVCPDCRRLLESC